MKLAPLAGENCATTLAIKKQILFSSNAAKKLSARVALDKFAIIWWLVSQGNVPRKGLGNSKKNKEDLSKWPGNCHNWHSRRNELISRNIGKGFVRKSTLKREKMKLNKSGKKNMKKVQKKWRPTQQTSITKTHKQPILMRKDMTGLSGKEDIVVIDEIWIS